MDLLYNQLNDEFIGRIKMHRTATDRGLSFLFALFSYWRKEGGNKIPFLIDLLKFP